jgi:catechol 2,3-dioxygenase-like lactoylglutathione lyase family enzyme
VTTAAGVHHVALICRDVEETIRFYQDFLGFPLVELVENRDYPGSSHFFFDIGNRNLRGRPPAHRLAQRAVRSRGAGSAASLAS